MTAMTLALANRQKAAAVLVALGPERASLLLQNLDEDTVSDLASEVAAIGALPAGQTASLLRDVAQEIVGRRGVELTDREWEVLELMKQGLTTDEIATRLFISPVTVRTHVSAVLRKLHVPTREAALELLER